MENSKQILENYETIERNIGVIEASIADYRAKFASVFLEFDEFENKIIELKAEQEKLKIPLKNAMLFEKVSTLDGKIFRASAKNEYTKKGIDTTAFYKAYDVNSEEYKKYVKYSNVASSISIKELEA